MARGLKRQLNELEQVVQTAQNEQIELKQRKRFSSELQMYVFESESDYLRFEELVVVEKSAIVVKEFLQRQHGMVGAMAMSMVKRYWGPSVVAMARVYDGSNRELQKLNERLASV